MHADFASRPLTFVSGPMIDLARTIGGRIVATTHRCGCYVTFRVVGADTPTPPDSMTIAHLADISAWLDYAGGNAAVAGAALTTAATQELRDTGLLIGGEA